MVTVSPFGSRGGFDLLQKVRDRPDVSRARLLVAVVSVAVLSARCDKFAFERITGGGKQRLRRGLLRLTPVAAAADEEDRAFVFLHSLKEIEVSGVKIQPPSRKPYQQRCERERRQPRQLDVMADRI